MSVRYVVKRGDCLSSIAFAHGFFPMTLWDHADNADLRRKRRDNESALAPGDEVAIPDKRLREEAAKTGAVHRFRRKNVPAKFRVELVGEDAPLADMPFTMRVDGKQTTGVTSEKGVIERYISPAATSVEVTVGAGEDAYEYVFSLGGLDPACTPHGAQQRLANLGFLDEEAAEEEDGQLGEHTTRALRTFQQESGLPVTGELDDPTMAKLEAAHDEE